MPAHVTSAARRAGVTVRETDSLEEVLADTDVLYVTRVQKERFAKPEDWEMVKNSYVVNHAVLARAKPEMIVMHPLPRNNGKLFLDGHYHKLMVFKEIDPEVDFDARRAVYFRQMRYGLFVSQINTSLMLWHSSPSIVRFAWLS
jgi:carbamoyl-phosphate synthase/aspartate carbamoyltransferase